MSHMCRVCLTAFYTCVEIAATMTHRGSHPSETARDCPSKMGLAEQRPGSHQSSGRRGRWGVLVVVLFLATPTAAQYCAYVTDLGGTCGTATLRVFNTASHRLTASRHFGHGSGGFGGRVAITPDGHSAYVTTGICTQNDVGSNVNVIETSSNTVTHTISFSELTGDILVTPDGRFAWVSTSDGNLHIIDTATNTLTGTTIALGFGDTPNIAITPDGRYIYAGRDSPPISVVDTSRLAVTATIDRVGSSSAVAITPDGRFAYAGAFSFVSVIDTATNTKLTDIRVVPIGRSANTSGIAISPDGSRAYVAIAAGSGGSGGNVTVIDIATNTLVETIPIGPTAPSIAITPDGRFAWVPLNITGFGLTGGVDIIDTGTKQSVASLEVYNPARVAFAPGTLCEDMNTACAADCNNDHAVTVDEIIILVNIALGGADVSTCVIGDANHDNEITINEILSAVNAALNGCAG